MNIFVHYLYTLYIEYEKLKEFGFQTWPRPSKLFSPGPGVVKNVSRPWL